MNTMTGFGLVLLIGLSGCPLRAQVPPQYEQIAPLFAARCVLCHSGPAAPLGLRLDTLEGVLKGSDRSVVVKAGNAEESELIRRVKGISMPRMPMTGPPWLSDAEIALLQGWVEGGLQAGTPLTQAPISAAQSTTATGRQASKLTVEIVTPTPIVAAALLDSSAEPRERRLSSKPDTASPAKASDEFLDYADVAPIFAIRCVKCHTNQGLLGSPPEGFRLDSYVATLAFEDRARVVPGQPGASELLRRIKGQARPRMPFDGPPWLSDVEVELIERWIIQGARDSSGLAAPLPTGADVRLHGTLSAANAIDGWTFERNGATRIDKNPQPGSYVQLRGTIAADGRVQAERLRRR